MSYIKKIKCLIEQVNNIVSFRPKLDYDPVTEILTGTFANGKHASTPLQIPTFTCEDLENCQEIIDIKDSIPTNNSELLNDSGYLTCEDLESCQVIEIIQQDIDDIKDLIPTDVSELTDDEELLFSGDYNDLDNKPTIPTDVSDLTDDSNLFFDGDYNSLDNLPSIPTNNSELANDSGYLTCIDLIGCPEIIEIINTIPTDISDLSDTSGVLLEYKKWQLQFFNQTIIIQLEATPNNIATFTSGVGTGIGTIEVSSDGVTYSPLVFPFSPSVGTWYFKRLNSLTTGVYTISE